MNALYDYIVKDIEAFCDDYANDLSISTNGYDDTQYCNAAEKFWVMRRDNDNIDFPYSICILESDGTLSEIDYCNQGRIQEWLQKGIIRSTTLEDFVTNKRTLAYLEGLRRINIFVNYNTYIEKAVEQVLDGTQLEKTEDIVKFAAQSFHHFVYLLSKMVQVTIIPDCGGNNA